jgi:hypothetical protein
MVWLALAITFMPESAPGRVTANEVIVPPLKDMLLN